VRTVIYRGPPFIARMACPFCGTPYEGPYCPSCGRDLAGTIVAVPVYPPCVCGRCGGTYAGPACPYCGAPFGTAPSSGAPAVGSVFWSLAMAVYFVLLAACLIAFFFAAALIVQGAVDSGWGFVELYVLLPYPVGDAYDVGTTAFLAYFALVAAGILGAYLWLGVRDTRAAARAFSRPLTDFRARFESRSAWIATGQVFLAALFFQFAFVLILALGGYDPQAPEYPGPIPDWYQYYALANASVYEEFVARWLLIGVPLVFAAALLRVARGPASVGTTPLWRHLFGGTLTRESPRSLLLAAAVLVPLSAVVFGLAHVPSWGLWKFFPTAVAGLGMGYLFVRHGFLAGVMFHFATDYLGALSLFAGDNLGAQVALGVLILALVLLGSFFFFAYGVYFVRLFRHFAGTLPPEPTPAATASAPAPAPAVAAAPTARTAPAEAASPVTAEPAPAAAPVVPAYGTSPVSFTCARCGGQEARYEAGTFTCLRCGHASP